MRQLQLDWHCRYVDTTTLYDVPPLLWSEFYNALLPFLELRMGVGQILVFRWSCRLLMDVVNQRYLKPGECTTTETFMSVADYFRGSLVKEDETTTRESTYINY